MTQEQFNTQFDEIHDKAEGMLAKVNEKKASSSFTETLEKKREVVTQWLSDQLDILFNRNFEESQISTVTTNTVTTNADPPEDLL